MTMDSSLHVIFYHHILFILVIFGIAQSSLSSGCIKSERDSLLNFKDGLNDPGSMLSSWTGSECCTWHGVGCDNGTGHVVKLDLHNQLDEILGNYVLGGEIRPSLLGLKRLTHLDLSLNSFNMISIPSFIGSLGRLRYLNLSMAGFSGKIPPHIGNITGLHDLDLSLNSIYGEVPSSIGYLQNLRVLYLSGNNISGEIPSSIGNLHNLQSLDLSSNIISGEIPSSIGNLQNLQELSLSSNTISGAIPLSISNLQNLQILYLAMNNISGELPPIIGNLQNLQMLYVSYNNIGGEIPSSIGNLQNLQELSLAANNINGEIPSSISNLQKLQKLYLSGNSISGDIPSSIDNLQNLKILSLSSTSISGEIPSSIGNLQNLQWLDLSSNNISGSMDGFLGCCGNCSENIHNVSVAGCIGKLLHLKHLNVGSNKLSGTIPKGIGQLLELELLDLSSNAFEGVMSEAHFANLTKLDTLYLCDNLFKLNLSPQWVPPFQAEGEIEICSCRLGPDFPAWLHTQTKFTSLDISNNGISDIIPNWFWNLSSSATKLNLSENQMRGKLPQDAFEFYDLGALDLRSNQFDGPLPRLPTFITLLLSNNSFSGPIVQNDTVPMFPGDGYLLLSHNLIYGSIPSSICKWRFGTLDLSYNYLSGVLPDCWSSHLEVINLSNNNLSGVIPSSMGSTYLKSLHLNNNRFFGELPSSLKNSEKLAILDLGDNELSGSIPMWLGENLSFLKALRLRSNKFGGHIPPQLSQLASLQVLDLAHNNFSGIIPSLFGNFSSMVATQKIIVSLFDTSPSLKSSYYEEVLQVTAKGEDLMYTRTISLLTSMDLSNNGLSGDIPKELMKLTGLRFLNLSGNQLAGKIPQNIGGLELLESLDLSLNQLSGDIPISISNLTFLERLNLSHNHLSGRIPSGNQLQTLPDPSIYIGNPNLCGSPLPVPCPGDQASQPIPSPSSGGGDENNGTNMIWFYMGLGPGFVAGFWGLMGVLFLKRSWRIALFRFFDDIWDWLYVKVSVKLSKWRSCCARTTTV